MAALVSKGVPRTGCDWPADAAVPELTKLGPGQSRTVESRVNNQEREDAQNGDSRSSRLRDTPTIHDGDSTSADGLGGPWSRSHTIPWPPT